MQVPVDDPLLPVLGDGRGDEKLGFGITVSATYEQPYALARRFGTLDHLTKGRIGWNIVTSLPGRARREPRPGPADRPRRALRDWPRSSSRSATSSGRAPGRTTRSSATRRAASTPTRRRSTPIGHHGTLLRRAGRRSCCEPSPQRTPVIFQAGASPRGWRSPPGTPRRCSSRAPPTTAASRKSVDRHPRRGRRPGRDPRSREDVPADRTGGRADRRRGAGEVRGLPRGGLDYEGALALYGGWTGLDLSGWTRTSRCGTSTPTRPARALEIVHHRRPGPGVDASPRSPRTSSASAGRGPVVVGVAGRRSPTRWSAGSTRPASTASTSPTRSRRAPSSTSSSWSCPSCAPRAAGTAYEGSTLRESLYGPGQARLREDHPGARYRRNQG